MSADAITRRRILREAKLLDEDEIEIRKRRGDHNRMGFGYQLTFVRLNHRFPRMDPFERVDGIARYVSTRLQLPEDLLEKYQLRRSTLASHRKEVLEYLEFQNFDQEQECQLASFLFEESFRIDQISALLNKAETFLRSGKVLIPSQSKLSRMASEQRVLARENLYAKISSGLSDGDCETLDQMLEIETGSSVSLLQRIKENPAKPSPDGMRKLLAKIQTIRETGILNVDISWVHPNYQRALYNHVRKSYINRLRKVVCSRRRALLVCYLHQRYRDGVDQIIDMFDKLMTRISTRSKNELKEEMFKQRKVMRNSTHFAHRVSIYLLDDELAAEDKVARILEEFSEEDLTSFTVDAEAWATGNKSHVFHLIARKHPYLRKFTVELLQSLTFTESEEGSSCMEAVQLLGDLNESGKRKLDKDAPTGFLSKTLRSMVVVDGQPQRHAWEAALMLKFRDEIKSGNILVEDSKRFGNFESFLLPKEKWETLRSPFFQKAGLPEDPKDVPDYLSQRLDDAYERFLEMSPGEVTFGNKGWSLKSDPAEEQSPKDVAQLTQLHQWLRKNMRQIRLPDLLIEVDNALHFTRHFQASSNRHSQNPKEVCSIIAAIIAHGCNLGLHTTESLIEGVSYAQLKRISDWQITPESQREALARIADGIAALDISTHWGEGKTSASDGQRFAYPRKTLQQSYSTRFQDFALEFYSFVADNYAPFYSLPIECQERDGGYVLDGLLYNESDLDHEEHYTDTHGYTEINFAAFTMLGRRFCPRIKNHSSQKIYKINPDRDYGSFASMLKSTQTTIDPKFIAKNWDEMGRFYASLEAGHTTASIALKRLVSYSRKNHFHRANQDFGRIIKTEFLLDYLSQPPLRKRIRRGLLKVEQLHQLARDIFFAKRGRISAQEIHQQLNSCSCLTLIAAAIIYWQAREMAKLLKNPSEEISAIDPKLIAHISPISWDNVVLYGEYRLYPNLVRP